MCHTYLLGTGHTALPVLHKYCTTRDSSQKHTYPLGTGHTPLPVQQLVPQRCRITWESSSGAWDGATCWQAASTR
jgi:hypothetical protein